MGQITTHFPCDLGQLEAVREFVDRVCEGCPDALKEQLELAIDEAFANIVRHSKPPGDVVLEGRRADDGVTFILKDQGVGFDPGEVRPPDFSGERSGGFGLYIIEQVADEITYIPKPSDEGWNELHIHRRVAWS